VYIPNIKRMYQKGLELPSPFDMLTFDRKSSVLALLEFEDKVLSRPFIYTITFIFNHKI